MPDPAEPIAPTSPTGPPPSPRPRLVDRALAQTVTLSVALLAAALFGLDRLGPLAGPGDAGLPWFAFALAFALTELTVFSLDIRHERTTFTFAEIPLVIGLFWASPLAVVGGRLLGELAVLALHDRLVPRKLLLNLSSFAAETVAAFVVFDATRGAAGITQPRSWAAALAATAAADAVSMFAVSAAKRFHGAPVGLASLVRTNVITLSTSTALAITGGLLLHEDPWRLLPLGAVVALVLLAWRSYARLVGEHDSLGLLYEFTRLAAGSRRSNDIVAPLLGRLRELLAVDYAAVHLFDGREHDGPPGQAEHWFDADDASLRALPADLAARTLDFEQDHRRVRAPSAAASADRLRRLAAALGRPDGLARALRAPDGTVLGALVVDAHRVDLGPFTDEDGTLFAELADHIGAALDNAKLIDRLREENRQRTHEARHDGLTGLANRSAFDRRLDEALRDARADGRAVGVGLMDLNRFKQVNDTLGHHVGDLLLTAVAERLRATLGPDCYLARLGGDEFALLVSGEVRVESLRELGERIVGAVR
ncbi:MAG: sensor domain-containing diguanylate cyclase, partial [Acidimicrobiales bacterium]|nr:sensor domain-containing diguanylate cyclase [Acidimicrobiales bacterium]